MEYSGSLGLPMYYCDGAIKFCTETTQHYDGKMARCDLQYNITMTEPCVGLLE